MQNKCDLVGFEDVAQNSSISQKEGGLAVQSRWAPMSGMIYSLNFATMSWLVLERCFFDLIARHHAWLLLHMLQGKERRSAQIVASRLDERNLV